MKVDDDPVIVEQTYSATTDAVWTAITDISKMRQWYFDNIPSFKAEVGFETHFNVTNEGRNFLHQWKVTEVVPRKKLTYDWSYAQHPGDGFVVWELFDEGDMTRLRLSMHIREDFSDDIPEFRRESCLAGWEYFIKQRLREYLESN